MSATIPSSLSGRDRGHLLLPLSILLAAAIYALISWATYNPWIYHGYGSGYVLHNVDSGQIVACRVQSNLFRASPEQRRLTCIETVADYLDRSPMVE